MIAPTTATTTATGRVDQRSGSGTTGTEVTHSFAACQPEQRRVQSGVAPCR
jgi:hypothetical protein